MRTSARAQAGFTLLELLAVIALLGVLAGAAVMTYDGVQDQGRDDVTRFEMAQIREALLQFRRDSGTNDFPGQGQYDCDDDLNGDSNTKNDALVFPDYVEAYPNEKDKVDWCRHPANFWMLFTDPLGRAEADRWDKDRKRGWNGPYLQRKSGLLSLAANIPSSQPAVKDVWGIADAYLHPFTNEILWNPAEPNSGTVYGPYLFFLDTSDDNKPDDRIASFGPDAVVPEPEPGIRALECLPNGNVLVLCLRR